MATNGAAFTSWETSELNYIAFGGSSTPGYTGGLPGMTTGPFDSGLHFGLTKTDPRAGVIYPNEFRNSATRNATYEPTFDEWNNYSTISKPRKAAYFEVVDAGGGVMQLKNKVVLAFAVPNVTTGPTMNYLAVMLLGATVGASYPFYLVGVMQLGTPYVVTVGTGLEIPIGSFVLEKK